MHHIFLKNWKKLSVNEKKLESKKMEIYAGMIENMDLNIGKLIEYLKIRKFV